MKPKLIFLLVLLQVMPISADNDIDSIINYYFIKSLSEELQDNFYEQKSVLENALKELPKSGNNELKATVYREYARKLSKIGNPTESHSYFIKAIDLYEKIPGKESDISICLYNIAIEFVNMRDLDGIKDILAKMKGLHQKHPDNHKIAYDYYSVLSTHYGSDFEKNPGNTTLRDSMMMSAKRAVRELERIPDIRKFQINPVWSYYNIAVMYDLYWENKHKQLDSIQLYLDKAQKANETLVYSQVLKDEGFISIKDLRAWLLYYQKDYAGAQKEMNETLDLIAKVEQISPNTVIIERGEAYSFFVEFYERLGNTAKALEYQKLLTANNSMRYDLEKNKALHDIKTKYEVEKKEQAISQLKEKNATARKILIFTVLIAGIALIVLVLAYIIVRLKQKNTEQRLYESALLAHSAQEELDSRNSQIAVLTQEYERLKKTAEKNKSKADEISDKLLLIRRQIDESPTKTLINKLSADLTSVSPKILPSKESAVERMSGLDVQQVDTLFASTTIPLSTMDKKYILCFLSGLNADEAATFFNVEQASVYTVRYRIKKKFPLGISLPF